MSQFKLTHPTDENVHALYGWDRALGFFVTIFSGARRIAEYDGFHPTYRDLQGALEVLAEHRFFSPDEFQIAIAELSHRKSDDLEEPSLRRCAEVIVNLRNAAD